MTKNRLEDGAGQDPDFRTNRIINKFPIVGGGLDLYDLQIHVGELGTDIPQRKGGLEPVSTDSQPKLRDFILSEETLRLLQGYKLPKPASSKPQAEKPDDSKEDPKAGIRRILDKNLISKLPNSTDSFLPIDLEVYLEIFLPKPKPSEPSSTSPRAADSNLHLMRIPNNFSYLNEYSRIPEIPMVDRPQFETRFIDYRPGRRLTPEEEQEAQRRRKEYMDRIMAGIRGKQLSRPSETSEPEKKEPYVPTVVGFKQNPAQVADAVAGYSFFPGEYNLDFFRRETDPGQLKRELVQLFKDKGFDVKAGFNLAQDGSLGTLFRDLVLRSDNPELGGTYNYWFSRAFDQRDEGFYSLYYGNKYWLNTQAKYEGSPSENVKVDSAIAASRHKTSPRRQFSGRGATRIFDLATVDRRRFTNFVRGVPIVIIGGGPAGLMATREMIEMGFDPQSITVIDRSGEYGGIWNQKNVAGGSKNNPFRFEFENLKLEAAPGDGSTVAEFLQQIEDPNGTHFAKSLPKPVRGVVTEVKPGDLEHKVTYKTKEGVETTVVAPIVINAIGNGKPLNPSREGHMTTDTPSEAGIRWQQILSEKQAEKYRGKTLVFIGLGNSTAEMLVQLKYLNSKGYNIDYRVVTHYPTEAVVSPEQEVERDGNKYKVFRDTRAPNLVKWEGDLEEARDTYYQALSDDKIIPEVTRWHLENGKMTVTTKSGKQETIDCEQLFTLIGYGHDPEILRAMGMTVTDEYLGSIAYDYDGEIQKQPGAKGRDRVYTGYFGLGSLLKSKENPNAVVMPGIMHRMYDLLFSAAIRAAEYKQRRSTTHDAIRIPQRAREQILFSTINNDI